MYAAGKIPGGFFKREGRATERATLTARMIDRPIRPLWPKGFRNEVQVICTVLSADLVTPHDILCINGASAALTISPLPFLGPVGAVRDRPDRRRARRQPDARAARGVDARPDRRRHARGADDGRGRRRPGARGRRSSRRSSSRTPRSARSATALEELASQAGKPKWVDPELHGRARRGARRRRSRGDREHGLREAGHGRRRARRELVAGDHDGVHRGGHDQRAQVRAASRRSSRRRASRRSRRRARAVRGRPARAHRRRAGLEGAQVAPSATCSSSGSSRSSSCRSRSARRRRGRAAGQGLADAAVRQEGGRGGLQGPRPQEDRGREAPPGRPRRRGDPHDRVRGAV